MKPSVVIRHYRERRSKCSLTPLEARGDIEFHRFRPGWRYSASGHVLLGLDAPELSPADAERPLLLLDSTWRLLPQLENAVTGSFVRRSLPRVASAYPRISKIADDPLAGLASVEALYLARLMLGAEDASLLDHYRWRDAFLAGLPKKIRSFSKKP